MSPRLIPTPLISSHAQYKSQQTPECANPSSQNHFLCRSSARGGGEGSSRSSAVARVITTASGLERVGLGVATIGSQVTSNRVVLVVLVVSGGVDTDLDPCKESVGDVVAKVEELRERIVAGICLNDAPHVVVIGGDIDGVGVVRVGGLYSGAERLGVEELSNVGDGLVEDRDGAVGQEGGVGVGQQVSVGSTTAVVTGEDGLERDHTLVVGQLDTTEVGGVDSILSVVSRDGDSRVDTSGVGVPDVHSDGGHRGTGADINVLDLEEQIQTIRVDRLLDVGTEVLSLNVVRTSSHLGSEDARGVGIEDILKGGEHVPIRNASVVMVHCLPLLKSSQVAAVLLGLGLDATLLAKSLHLVGTTLKIALLNTAGGSRA